MTTELKTQILDKIDQILKFDLSKLYPRNPNVKSWNDVSTDQVEQFVAIIKGILNDIRENASVLETVSPLDLKLFERKLTDTIRLYEDRGLPSLAHEQITDQHHRVMTELSGIYSTIRQNGVYIDLKALLTQRVGRFSEAETIANTLASKSTTIIEAITSAEKWLSTRQSVNGKTIEEQAEAFYDMANEHRVFRGWLGSKRSLKSFRERIKIFFFECDLGGSWFWLFLTLLFAVLTGLITFKFVISDASIIINDITVGAALLRIAGLIVPGYLTLFSSNQFLYHKRLYDNYMFKYSSMKTMNNLVSVHKEQGERVLDKGLDILFAEPRVKELSGKYDSQLINELIKMLRDQIGK